MVVSTLILLLLGGLFGSASSHAATVPTGFRETTVFSGLTNPMGVRFASDGRVFVAEKRGVIKVFDDLSDTTPTTFADLRTQVHNFWDRGMLGLALDPGFPDVPYVYVLYTHDAPIGGTAPRWGTADTDFDSCPDPPGATSDGCVVSGRLSRLKASGNAMTGTEQVLIEDWCQQYPSHSIGSLAFGPDGALYASAGDGAHFNFVDYGQEGDPVNPCGDPPGGVGATLTPPTAEGGALRSQDLRTGADPTTLDGTIVRVDPDTGAGLATNPMAASSDPNTRRIIAYGLRNPFRFTFRPGTSELWLGDVGWSAWEEIDRIASPTDTVVENFGWPCYEGAGRQAGYADANLNLCESLYGPGPATPPYHAYNHGGQVVAGENCPTGSSSVTGLAFYGGGSYPAEYDGALFFADYARDCIWAMQKDSGGLPSPSKIRNFVTGAANPVDLQIGAGGDLFYADVEGGMIQRIKYTAGNQPPTAVATATPTSGSAPLTVSFDGRGSSDLDPGDTLTYAWDLDGDGAFDDSTSATPSHTYTADGVHTASVKLTDSEGASSTAAVRIDVANTPPTATITTPSPTTTWAVGDTITFTGSATDAQDGSLPASSLTWSLIMHHCPSNCHAHLLQTWDGATGSFPAPDHEYPSHLELRLTATDARGLTDTRTVRLDPKTVDVTLTSTPPGLELALNGVRSVSPLTRTVIQRSSNTVSAPSPQTKDAKITHFVSWSDGGAATHNVTADSSTTYTATFEEQAPPPSEAPAPPPSDAPAPPPSDAPAPPPSDAPAPPPSDAPAPPPHARPSALLGAMPPAAPAVAGSPPLGPPLMHPAKLEVARSKVLRDRGALDVLAPITKRASGPVQVDFRAAGRRTRFAALVNEGEGRVRFRQPIPREQAELGTGILTMAYSGNHQIRGQQVRLRAAPRPARLELDRPSLRGGRLRAHGSISDRARGAVRVQLSWATGGRAHSLELQAPIRKGRWVLEKALPAPVVQQITDRDATVHSYTLFTGYLPARMRGEMEAHQVLGAPR